MTIEKAVLFMLVCCFGYSRSSFVDILKPCSLQDKECQITLMQNILINLSEKGAPEYSIPSIDPFHVENLDASIAKVLDFIFIRGTVTGVKKCIINDVTIDMEHLLASIELTTDITIEGTYNVTSNTDAFEAIFGGNAHGEGNGRIEIEQIKLKIEFPFKVVKRGEDFFVTSELKKYKYSFKILKKITFHADNLYLGGKESSKDIIKLVNENWTLLVDAFGSHFLKVAVKFMNPFIKNIFGNVPTKYYIKEDLSKYVT